MVDGKRHHPATYRDSHPLLPVEASRDRRVVVNHPEATRRRAAEAFHLSNELVMDLTVGANVYEVFRKPALHDRLLDVSFIGVTRMCVFHIVLCLAKWAELYDRYKSVLPEDLRRPCRELAKELRRREVRRFRNKIAGHIWDTDLNAPLPTAEVMDRLSTVCDGDFPAFLRWVNDPDASRSLDTVVGLIQVTRDRIADEYSLTDADLRDFRFQFPRS